jgi:hypothetical protein
MGKIPLTNAELIKALFLQKRNFGNNEIAESEQTIIANEWDKIYEYFLAFQEWHNTPNWYHYIGFLVYCGVSIIEIYNLYDGKNKNEFGRNLVEKIKTHKNALKELSCEQDNDGNYSFDLSYDKNKDRDTIRKILLLFNIEFIVQQYDKIQKITKTKEDNNFIIKFPFKLFKNEDWDVEHIDSQTPNEKDQNEWLEIAKEDLLDESNKELTDKINDFLSNENSQNKFEDLYKEICSLSGEVDNDEEAKDSVGNLTLLNADINRSYGNSLFQTKRRIIIEKDMEGKFIPICTKHVFLKYFDKKGTSRTKWGEYDITNYQNHIGTVLRDFLIIENQQRGDSDE